MTRFPSSFSIRFFAASVAVTACCACGPISLAHADEFSVLPAGDPMIAQLSILSRASDNKTRPSNAAPSLTRYEAALQTARSILDAQDGHPLSRLQWGALKNLATALRPELQQLGVDVDAAIALAQTQSKKPASSKPAAPAASLSSTSLSSPGISAAFPPLRGALMGAPRLLSAEVKSREIQIPLSPSLRLETELLALQNRDGAFKSDPNRAASGGLPSLGLSQSLASQNSLSYDLNRWLTVRAATSKRQLGGDLDAPLFDAPFFAGATDARAAGGGVDVNLAPGLRFSTEVERLRANTGASAARIGGGIGLSALQNRLSMSMNLSRLVPENASLLPSTAAELNVGVDITRHLSLNLLYQGLFSQTPNSNASRVAGGLSLNF